MSPLLELTEKWETLPQHHAARSGIEPGGMLAIGRGRLLQGDDLVAGNDEIEVFPALSGGKDGVT